MRNLFDDIFNAFSQEIESLFQRSRGRSRGMSSIMSLLEDLINEVYNDRPKFSSSKEKRKTHSWHWAEKDPFDDFFYNDFDDFFSESFYQENDYKYNRNNRYSNENLYDKFSGFSKTHESGLPYDNKIAHFYCVLNLDYGSGLVKVKTAWKQMCKKYHPDYFSHNPELQKKNTKVIQKCTEAYKEIEKFLKRHNFSS